ncbi:MAG: hypothetical protein ACTMIR_13635, partial [Cellulomonadaceae bacterium]
SVDALRQTLTHAFLHTGTYSTFRHTVWGAPVPIDTDGHRFVVFAANHDQVGNRALGDRPSGSLSAGHLAITAAIVFTSAFTPMLFMGDEWGASTDFQFFTDHEEPELAAAVSQGRTQEFGGHGWASLYGPDFEVPDPQDPATREHSVLRWDEATRGVHGHLLAWHRRLVRLRREAPDLASGDLRRVEVVEDGFAEGVPAPPHDPVGPRRQTRAQDGPQPGPLRIRRGRVSVLLNPTGHRVRFEVARADSVLASWQPAVVVVGTDDWAGSVVVEPDSVTIVGPDPGR